MAQLKILSHLLLVTSKPHQTPESQNLQILQAVCPGSGGAGLRKPGAGTLQRSPVALPRKRKLMETYGNLPNLCRLPNLSSSHQKDALLESKHWIFVDRQLASVGHLACIYQGAELKGLGFGANSLEKNMERKRPQDMTKTSKIWATHWGKMKVRQFDVSPILFYTSKPSFSQ